LTTRDWLLLPDARQKPGVLNLGLSTPRRHWVT